MKSAAPPNPQLQLAEAYLAQTGVNLFLTGRAGTGKTTFLKGLREKTPKRMVIAAPTGVAAINAGGVTLHSLFQMPFGPFVPGAENQEQFLQRKFNREKRNLIKSLDLMVIDEISMVRADLLDHVDAVLRRLRKSDAPFGGVQLLMIGDLHQLPPVAKEEEWALLREFYDSPYFFASQALSRTEFITVELQRIYRQSDPHFIDLLNRVRDNTLDAATLDELNRRHRPDFSPKENEGYITLCTHNRNADAINEQKLGSLAGKARSLEAEVSGEFPEYSYPTAAKLDLKAGAQVMFVKNDPSPEKLFFNGKIGRVTRIAEDTVWVRCADGEPEIEVEPAIWDNLRYALDEETREIREEKIGSFIQYPLKLAWAITIHKSQGLTFDRAVIDANAAFAHGQVYVALSRCRTLEGLVLRSAIPRSAVRTDEAVRRFSEEARQHPPAQEHFAAARVVYQQRLMLECFDFGRLRYWLGRLWQVLGENARVVRVSYGRDRHEWQREVEEAIFTVAENFRRQLERLFPEQGLPETDAVLKDRAVKASAWFSGKLEEIWTPFFESLLVDTDNKEVRKRVKDAMERLATETAVRLAAVKSCAGGFEPVRYLKAVSGASLEKPAAGAKKSSAGEEGHAGDVSHPELFRTLREWRMEEAREQGVPAFHILHQRVLVAVVEMLPETIADLKNVPGIGKKLAAKYGEDIVSLVRDYRRKHNVTVAQPAPKPSGGVTAQLSFDLFRSGLTATEVAAKRGLALSTIEGHLFDFVVLGELGIERLVPEEQRQTIEQTLETMAGQPLGAIKNALGPECSYSAIRFVQAFRRRQGKR